MIDGGPHVLTVDELAAQLRIGRRAAYEAVRRGEVPGVIRVGRSIRVSVAAIDQWINGGAGAEVGNGEQATHGGASQQREGGTALWVEM